MSSLSSPRRIDRRRLLQILGAAGIAVPAASDLLAQARRPITVENLKYATAIVGQDFSDERLKAIEPALQRNLDQFQIVRDFEIADAIEPAPVFIATRR